MANSIFCNAGIRAAALATTAILISCGGIGAANAATNSVKCGDGVVSVSTGDNSGSCVSYKSSSGFNGIKCESGASVARGGCTADNKAQCGNSSSGGGSCTITMRVPKGQTLVNRTIGGAKQPATPAAPPTNK